MDSSHFSHFLTESICCLILIDLGAQLQHIVCFPLFISLGREIRWERGVYLGNSCDGEEAYVGVMLCSVVIAPCI